MFIIPHWGHTSVYGVLMLCAVRKTLLFPPFSYVEYNSDALLHYHLQKHFYNTSSLEAFFIAS